MNTFEVKEWESTLEKVTYYTVTQGGDEAESPSETDKFFNKYYEKEEFREEVQELMSLIINEIGNKYGAIPAFFTRHKRKATALPPKSSRKLSYIGLNYSGFRLRLYTLRISEGIVILFNGGIKDQRTDQESKDLSMKFHETQRFVTAILQGLKDRIIEEDHENRKLVSFDGTGTIII